MTVSFAKWLNSMNPTNRGEKMKREYSGDAIDLSWKQIQDRNVVSGGSVNEDGDVTTSLFSENDTELQQEIKEIAWNNPETTVREIANRLDCNFAYVSEVLKSRGGRRDRSKDSEDELTETQSKIVYIAAYCPEKTHTEIAEQVGVSVAYVSMIRNDNEKIISEIRSELDETQTA